MNPKTNNNLVLIGLVILSISSIYLLYLNFSKIKDISRLKEEFLIIKNSITNNQKNNDEVLKNLIMYIDKLNKAVFNNQSQNTLNAQRTQETNPEEIDAEVVATNPEEINAEVVTTNLEEINAEVVTTNPEVVKEVEVVEPEVVEVEATNSEEVDDDLDLELELTEEDISNINSLELNQENLEILNSNNKEIDMEFKNQKIVENLENSIQDIANEQTNNLDSFLSNNEKNIETDEVEVLEDIDLGGSEEVEDIDLGGSEEVEDELNDLSLDDLDSKSVNLEVLDNIKVDNDPDNLESIDRKKIKSKKYLNTLTVKQLKGLCKELGVKSRGNKDELVKTLMK